MMDFTSANPFSAHCVRPGVLPFFFPEGASVDALIERLRASRWRGQIVGPHGSGKTTLLHALLPHLEAAGLALSHLSFQGGQFVWRRHGSAVSSARRMVVIDGFEQLNFASRWLRLQRSWLLGEGLLVTAHCDMGLPTLYETVVTAEMAHRIVEQLLNDAPCQLMTPADVDGALASHPGDMRSVLFALYDLYELRRRARAGA